MSSGKRIVLYNEAIRQRLLDVQMMSQLISADKVFIEKVMTIHGGYTEGFYETQQVMLREKLLGHI
jgi:hypothetical protein